MSDSPNTTSGEEAGDPRRVLAKKRNHLAQRRTELARERTDRAEDRTGQAAERTFSAWLRTGITAEVTGLAVVKLLGELGPSLLLLITGVLFVLVAAGAYVTAWGGYLRRQRLLKGTEQHATRTSFWLMQAMVLFLLVSAAGALAIIFV